MEDKIFKEINKIINSNYNDNDCISLYDVAKIIKLKLRKFDKMIKSYEEYIDNFINKNYKETCKTIIQNFDYETNELKISILSCNNWYNVILAKNCKDLYIKKIENEELKKTLYLLKNQLSRLYNTFSKYKEYFKDNNINFKAVNTNFKISINRFRIVVFKNCKKNSNNFEISLDILENKYNVICNSNTILDFIKGKERVLFKKIFIKNDNYPK